MRTSRQRQVILEELQRAASHPTADELLARVRERMPKVSLGTVYRNLELLADLGLAQVIEDFGGQRRYDGDTRQHSHIRCVRCGAIADLMLDPTAESLTEVQAVTAYKVFEVRLVCTGLCPNCQVAGGGADIRQQETGSAH
ncbi:MAG: transcriptional repressor [Armatimonadetes bacterium]|nr:transcriptional repressor [Armatimonadota bacterium]